MLFDYDDTSVESILNYAKRLEGMTFKQVMDEYNNSPQKKYINSHGFNMSVAEPELEYVVDAKESKAKGQLGNFLERFYFGYMPNGLQEADFSKTGIELKQTCIDVKKDGEYTAGERLSITNISYKEPVEDDFYKSHVWEKVRLILLIHYLRDRLKDRFDYEIKFVNLFSPPQDDLNIIIEDYKKIINKIKEGRAHEISESDTLYLGACTKGATAEKSKVPQYYGNHTLAKKRNFCFKRQYMDYVLHDYVLKNNVPCESIIKINKLNSNDTFVNQILSLINIHKGQSDKELCKLYKQPYNSNKALWVNLAYRMLGIKSNRAEEFLKANIVVKAIRLEKNGHIKESMSFPTITFKEFVNETYEESDFCKYFEETKFLFVVYKANGKHYILQGAQLWNMPAVDLYGDAKTGWDAIQKRVKDGIKFTIDGCTVLNNLPKKTDNRIIHIRPHAQKSAFRLHNGFEKGNVQKDGDELPNGEFMTKQSLWLNNSYILSQLDSRLLK